MEDEDCFVNDEGHIDVRYRGWIEIHSSIWNFYDQLMSLDLSFNHLQSIPEEIGNLRRLKRLNCENNEIEKLPESLGRLRALKILKLNRNRLTALPDSIGNCFSLKMLYLDDNKLETLPHSIGNCQNLELLELKNNNLIELPLSIAKLKETLCHMDVTNNPNLAIIPEKMQGNSEVIMWILVFRYERTMELIVIRQGIKDMAEVMRNNRDQIESAKTRIKELQLKQRDLVVEREGIWIFLRFRDFRRRVQYKAKQIIRQGKNLFDQRSAKISSS